MVEVKSRQLVVEVKSRQLVVEVEEPSARR